MDTDFDLSEEEPGREGEGDGEREGEDFEPRKKRKQWIKPAKPQKVLCTCPHFPGTQFFHFFADSYQFANT